MNIERTLTLIYLVLGISIGILSVYLTTMISLVAGAALYIVSFFIIRIFADKKKKFSWYILNTLLTFILVWMVTWIFVFNL